MTRELREEPPPGPRTRLTREGATVSGAEPARGADRVLPGLAPDLGRRLLACAGPREILARITDEDPLGLRMRVADRMRQRRILLDAERAELRALARVACSGPRWRGRPGIDAWLDLQVDEALDEVLAECVRERRAGQGSPGGLAAALALPLGIDALAATAVLTAYDSRPDDERESFHRWVIEGATLDDVARALGVSASEVGRRARRVLEALLEAAGPASPVGAREAGR